MSETTKEMATQLNHITEAVKKLIDLAYRAGCDDTIAALKNAAKKETK